MSPSHKRQLSPLVSGVSSEPQEVGLQPRSYDSAPFFPLFGPLVLGPDGDLVPGCSHCLHVFPLLFIGDESSPDEGVVQEDVQDIVPGLDIWAHRLQVAYDMLGVEWSPSVPHHLVELASW